MAGLSKKETRALLTDLEKQGARLRKTRNGMRILGPHGRTTALHWTHSDNRSVENLRAEVRRMGYQWPFDGENRTPRNFIREEPAMSAVQDEKIEYPGYITTMRQRPTDATLAKVRGGIVRLGTDEVYPATLSTVIGANQSHVVRVLYWLGYRYDPRLPPPRPWRLIPEHDRSQSEHLPIDLHLDVHVPVPKKAKPVTADPYEGVPEHVKAAHGITTTQKHVAEPEPEEPQPVVEPEREQEEPITPEEEQDMAEENEVQGEVVQVRFTSNQPSVPERVATSSGEPREILDTYDSWTFPITDRIAHKKVAEVVDELLGYGLQMEIRVWREG